MREETEAIREHYNADPQKEWNLSARCQNESSTMMGLRTKTFERISSLR